MQTGQQLPYAKIFSSGPKNKKTWDQYGPRALRGKIGSEEVKRGQGRSEELRRITYFGLKSGHFYIVWMDIVLNKQFFRYRNHTIYICLVDLATLHRVVLFRHLAVDKTYQRMGFLDRVESCTLFYHGCKCIFDRNTTIVHYDCNCFYPTEGHFRLNRGQKEVKFSSEEIISNNLPGRYNTCIRDSTSGKG